MPLVAVAISANVGQCFAGQCASYRAAGTARKSDAVKWPVRMEPGGDAFEPLLGKGPNAGRPVALYAAVCTVSVTAAINLMVF